MIEILLQLVLLGWYFISLYLVAFDKTLSFEVRVIGEIINILVIGYIITNMFDSNNKNIIFYIVGFLLIAWYLYFTYKDFTNAGYSLTEKIIYGTVDIITLLYLIITQCLAFLTNIEIKLTILSNVARIKNILFGI